jgi:hypothetical protein
LDKKRASLSLVLLLLSKDFGFILRERKRERELP